MDFFRAYNTNQLPQQTIDLFREMREKYQVKPNTVSNIFFIQACVITKSFDLAKALHEDIKQKTPNYFKNKVRERENFIEVLPIGICLGISQSDHCNVYCIR